MALFLAVTLRHRLADVAGGADAVGVAAPTPLTDLQRFVEAQADGVHERALDELVAGRKRGHWMWFVLPQVAGLGRSETAARYALPGLDGPGGARAYLAHSVLGPRLRACARALSALPGHDPVAVLGPVDAAKLRSCMTLFEAAAGADADVFAAVLQRFFGGRRDEATLSLLAADGPPAPRRRR